VAISGLLFGYVAYRLGAPALWAAGARPGRISLALIAAVAAGAAEELVFRGPVQVTFQRTCGRLGIAGVTALFASTYLGAGTAALVLLYALAGIAFAHLVARTESLAGALLGHVLLAGSAGGLWPVVFGRGAASWAHAPVAAAIMAGVVVVAAAIALRRPVPARAPAVTAERQQRHG
jgi:membrane protease YdiL (CAAX protease family)